MKATYLISIIFCLTFQFIYGQVENSTVFNEMNYYGNVKSITEKYYSTKYKNGEFKKANLQLTNVYNFNDKRNIMNETADEMSTWSNHMIKLRFYESGVAHPNLNFRNGYNKNLNWKGRMLNDYKQSTFISDMLIQILNKDR